MAGQQRVSRRDRKASGRVALLVALVLASGCTAVAYGAAFATVYGGVAYTGEKIHDNGALRDYPATLEQTLKVCEQEAQERKIEYKKEFNKEQGYWELKSSKGRLLVLPHPKWPKDYTRVDVKIGTFASDEKFRRTRAFLADLAKTLGEIYPDYPGAS